MTNADHKRLRELTIAANWTGRPDWVSIYWEMRGIVRDNEFYQDTRGTSIEYIEELRRLCRVAFDAAPKCERCPQVAGMFRLTGRNRCSAHLTTTMARRALAGLGYR